MVGNKIWRERVKVTAEDGIELQTHVAERKKKSGRLQKAVVNALTCLILETRKRKP
jgi:hypothetical protein